MNDGVRLPDFNVLVALHQHDPEAFEAFRRHLLREAVDYAPVIHRPALEKLLTRIETARESAATPMEAVLIASRMMQDSMNELMTTWEHAQQAVAGLQASLLIERVRNR